MFCQGVKARSFLPVPAASASSDAAGSCPGPAAFLSADALNHCSYLRSIYLKSQAGKSQQKRAGQRNRLSLKWSIYGKMYRLVISNLKTKYIPRSHIRQPRGTDTFSQLRTALPCQSTVLLFQSTVLLCQSAVLPYQAAVSLFQPAI